MSFEDALADRGFGPVSGRMPRDVRVFEAHPNRFLTYSVQAFGDGTALFSWEFAVGEYLSTKGIQFGSDETLNQFAYQVGTSAARRMPPGSRARSSKRSRCSPRSGSTARTD